VKQVNPDLLYRFDLQCRRISTGGRTATGIAIEFSTLFLTVGTQRSSNWKIQDNKFDGSFQGVFVNSLTNDITITGNSFTRCVPYSTCAIWLHR
jgi:hypothetical protein